jgi:hypothetical protein
LHYFNVFQLCFKDRNYIFYAGTIAVSEYTYKKFRPLKGYYRLIRSGRVNKKTWLQAYEQSSKYLSRQLVSAIKSIVSGYPENTKIFVTSDHGQLLGEGGVFGHGHLLDDNLIRVPLYVYGDVSIPDQKWVSLNNLYYWAQGKYVTQPYALSEVFEARDKKGNLYPSYRIAVYYKDYKGIFNVDDWKWECWKTYNGEEEVPEEAKKEMMRIVLNHLKKGLVREKARELGKKLAKVKKPS